jgi:hypothetical protein
LRIFQIGGRSAKQNAIELSFARGIDAAIIQSDILESLRSNPPYPGVDGYLRYVAKLYDKEVHVLATTAVKSIDELKGKKVNFGKRDSDNFATASNIFGKLGIDVVPTELSPTAALEQLREGEIAALVHVAPKPADLFNFGKDEKLHFLSIPGEPKHHLIASAEASRPPIGEGYTVTTLRPEDYYELIKEPVKTLAVGSVLMVYNWPRNSERYRKVARMVGRLLDEHGRAGTQTPISWPDIDIATSFSGWTRFAPAEQWKQAHKTDHELTKFAFVQPTPVSRTSAPLSEPEKLKLFTEFAAIQKRQQAAVDATDESGELFTAFLEYQKAQQSRIKIAGVNRN